METFYTVLSIILIVLGIVGIFVPALPSVVLVLIGIFVYAYNTKYDNEFN